MSADQDQIDRFVRALNVTIQKQIEDAETILRWREFLSKHNENPAHVTTWLQTTEVLTNNKEAVKEQQQLPPSVYTDFPDAYPKTFFNLTSAESMSRKDLSKFRKAEQQDISLLLVGVCVFCYAFIFYMIGLCAERRKPGAGVAITSSQQGQQGQGTCPHQVNGLAPSRSYSSFEYCGHNSQISISNVDSYPHHTTSCGDRHLSQQLRHLSRSLRYEYFDRPPRYNDLASRDVVIDIPEPETPPPTYNQVVARDHLLATMDHFMEIYELSRITTRL